MEMSAMQNAQKARPAGLLLAAVLMVIGVAACTSTPEPAQTTRSTLQTAPADLQLLCANAVATQTGAPADRVLPVSSRPLDPGFYQVELDAAGSRHSCVIDAEGNVASVT
jgi:hypothetical protein